MNKVNYYLDHPISHGVLYISVNSENKELEELYKEKIKEHNKQVLNDPFPNAGFDLFFPETVVFDTMDAKLVSMDIKCGMRIYDNGLQKWVNSGYYLYPRSSISKTPLLLANSTGIIDSGYRGNIMGAFRNLHANNSSYSVQKHHRLLQICGPSLQPLCVEFVKPSFFEGTTRENGGFGSTGL